MISQMKQQLADVLHDRGFISTPEVTNVQANKFSENISLVKAIICSGLYPNIAKVEYGHNASKFSSKTEKKINLHMKSVNSGQALHTKSQWVMYYEQIQMNGNVTLMESSLLKALPLVFFGGEITSRRLGDDNLVPQYDALVIDREVNVQCDQRQSSILMDLRSQVDHLIAWKVRNPSPTNWVTDCREGAILNILREIITSDTSAPVILTTADRMNQLDDEDDDGGVDQTIISKRSQKPRGDDFIPL